MAKFTGVILAAVAAILQIAIPARAKDAPAPAAQSKTVRVIYMVSSDRKVRADYRDAVEYAIRDLQKWYGKQLGGRTFKLHDPVVEVVHSEKKAEWFSGHQRSEPKDDWFYSNTLEEAGRVIGAKQNDPDYIWAIYSDGPGNTGQGGGGVCCLPEDDLLGLIGEHPTQKDKLRWIAGLGHELGHAFGLQHPADKVKDADAIMWAGIYGKYPDKTYLTAQDKEILRASPFFFAPDAPAPSIIPAPKQIALGQGNLVLNEHARIVAGDPSLTPLAPILADEIASITGIHLETTDGEAQAGDIVLRIDPALKGEAYAFDVDQNGAIVRGGNYDSVAAATATLLQALNIADGHVSLPYLHVKDEPAYPFRAALIDLARKYHTPGGIEQVIELCRFYKISYLHLHLSDDNLFMFPSAKFSHAGKSNHEFARFEPGSKPKIEPYTLEELKKLEIFARDRGVHLVPEIDLPGHSGRLIADEGATFGFPGNGSTVDIARPKTLEATTELLNEVMDVFASTPYIHLGADEVGLGGLEKTPEYAEAVKRNGKIRSTHDLYCKFVSDLCGIVRARGKTPIVWEEAFNPGGAYPLPTDAVVMSWSLGRNPNEITAAGYSVVNASWTPLYIVRDNCMPLDFLFNWDITKFGREGSKDFVPLKDIKGLLGAELCSWENSESIEIQMLRDRLAIVAERSWNPQAGGDLAAFKARLAHANPILEKLIEAVGIKTEGALLDGELTFSDPLTVTLSGAKTGLTIRYTLDNNLPDEKWVTYDGPIHLDHTAHIRAGLFDAQNHQQGYLSGRWFKRITVVDPNLATHKPVSEGPGPKRTDEWSAEAAVDGKADDPNHHWASTDPAPQWLQVDLEKEYPIDSINVITYWDGSRYYQFNVEASLDGKKWTKVVDFSGNKTPATAAGYSAKFPKTQARYVRVNMLKNSANPYVHIVELIVSEAK
ncbi:MAG TPA: family 20 glycosylhydrolase [Tepidisphaeraceae bacterium]|jgi:hexosaminidase|nr:family 20 glycosylhydrolase [Tepidisphaeraceae bacterium]